MSKHTVTAVFDTRAHAEQAIGHLETSGVPRADITSLPAAGEATTSMEADDGRSKGFWSSLEQLFGGTEDHATYAESIRRGGIMVSVRADDAQMDRIVDILEQHGSVDLDERETTWRGEGWTGTSVADTGAAVAAKGLSTGTIAMPAPVMPLTTTETSTAGRAVMDRAATPATGVAGRLRDAADDVIQVVEERLNVGKRSVNRGKVRVHTSVVSRDVSEDITLHDETVTVDRRVVDRPISAAALDVDPFRERTIEMEEYAEEAVVAKTAHVVEEIGIRKDAIDHVETVRETLRSTKVDIEDGRGTAGVRGGAMLGETARFVGEIRDDMEVVGSDGAHVGTVDHMDGGRIKLKKLDPAAGGAHHYLETAMVKSVAGKVMLAVTAAEAKAGWTGAGLAKA